MAAKETQASVGVVPLLSPVAAPFTYQVAAVAVCDKRKKTMRERKAVALVGFMV